MKGKATLGMFDDSKGGPKVGTELSLNGIYWPVNPTSNSTNFIRDVYMFDICERGTS